jgi:hypothetical protein
MTPKDTAQESPNQTRFTRSCVCPYGEGFHTSLLTGPDRRACGNPRSAPVARRSKPPELIVWASFGAARLVPQNLAKAYERLVVPNPRARHASPPPASPDPAWQELWTNRSAGGLNVNRINAAPASLEVVEDEARDGRCSRILRVERMRPAAGYRP